MRDTPDSVSSQPVTKAPHAHRRRLYRRQPARHSPIRSGFWGLGLNDRLNDLLSALRRPATIRARCASITASVSEGRSGYFTIERSRLHLAAERVAALTLRRFPDLRVPLHSHWRQFEAGGAGHKVELDTRLAGRSRAEQARARFDLTVVGVLLGAGAGWRYTGGETGPGAGEPARTAGGSTLTRSEDLGAATLRAFLAGTFSSNRDDPLRADATALQRIDAAALRAVLQAGAGNPPGGLESRAGLLSRLGAALAAEAGRTGLEPRPGLIFDRVTAGGVHSPIPAGGVHNSPVTASALLGEVLRTLAPVWRSGSVVKGIEAGDVWPHRWAGATVAAAGAGSGSAVDATTGGWVPFHALGQWLTYSLLEPLHWAGVETSGLDALTGLPDHRNGGLLLDSGVIVPRHARDLAQTWKVGDELIVEWRALTVTLLDELALCVRQRLGKTADELPLASILEGGTWSAGREIALEMRGDGSPPLKIESDGTVF